jgi:antitoxin component of MazEF toxin-antitoxin module
MYMVLTAASSTRCPVAGRWPYRFSSCLGINVRAIDYCGCMKTRLRKTGNSYGITIPSHIRRLLHLGPRCVLEVSTDGRRIMIEWTGELLQDDEVARARQLLSCEGKPPPPPSPAEMTRHQLQMDCAAVWRELERRYSIGTWQLGALYHQPNPRMMLVSSWLQDRNCVVKANDDELATVRRLRLCRDRLRAGDGWEKALELTLALFPKREVEAARDPIASGSITAGYLSDGI